MMSKRQICIYQQTGILDLTAIQSLSACHVSPRATLPSPKAHGSHASDAALLAYLLPIQRPPPNQKDARRTKQGVIFMNVSARDLLKPRVHLEQ